MKRALITGITGQDGAYLAELLLAKVKAAGIAFDTVLAPAMGGVTLNRLRLLEDARDLGEEFARAPHDEDRRRELMAACDKARRA